MRLQKTPAGLLELFDLKAEGSNPSAFGDGVLPTADLFDLYTADKLITGQWNGAAGVVNRTYTTLGALPDPPLMRLRAIAGAFTMGAAAGTFLRLYVGVRIASTKFTPIPTVPLWPVQQFTPPTVAITHYVGGYLSRPLVLQPGSELILISRGDAAGADHVPAVVALYEDMSPSS